MMRKHCSCKQEVLVENIRKKIINLSLILVILALVFPTAAVSSQDENTEAKKIYSEVAGDYAFTVDEGTFIITFFERNGSLIGYDHDDGEEVILKPVDLEKLEFETANSESVYFFLKFYRDDEGKVVRMRLSANGIELEGDRVK
jgi:hypothetical protein